MPRLLFIAWFVLTGCLAGCNSSQPVPKKEIQISGAGPPVLTSAERTAKEMAGPKRQPTTIAPASFEQPVVEPEPLKPFEQWTEPETAAVALGRIGAAAVPDLVQALQNPDADVRLKAVAVLGRMGSDAAAAVPQLIPLLNDPDVDVRKAAARTLGQIGPPAKDAVPALVRTLLQPDSPAAPPPAPSNQ
jgi:hypothetical protein